MEQDKRFFVKVRAIILHEGKLLVVRHSDNTSFVALPGGHLEWGEGLEECVRRELIEELGVAPEIGRLLYVSMGIQDINQCIEFFFNIKNTEDYLDIEKLVGSHTQELAEISWVSPEDDVHIMPRDLARDFKAGRIVSNEVRYIKY